MTTSIIENLRGKLNNNLPGEEAQHKMAPEFRDHRVPQSEVIKNQKSAVLLLLYKKNKRLHTCFIKRPVYNGPHSGQVSFPGGKYEAKDNDLIETALRESFEEIGINKNDINILGSLTPLKIPVSQMEVFPVVGFSNNTPNFKIDNQEVEYIIETDLNHLLKKKNIKKMGFSISNNKTILAPYFDVNNEIIWGATAMMLNEFLEVYKKAM